MRKVKLRTTPMLFAVAVLLSTMVLTVIPAQAGAVDPVATQTLKRMTDYLGGLKQFSVKTQTTVEDLLDSGHRVDLDISARVFIDRANRLRAEREGDLIDQVFYYDGKNLTLFNPTGKVYATESAPPTIEGLLDFARESLGISVPAADLVYRNAFTLLTENVTLAKMIGKAVINGVKCDHLLFSRPGVDFQVWVAEGDRPLPLKYVVTDTGTPELLSIITVMSDWNVASALTDAQFAFVAPEGCSRINFMPLKTGTSSNR